MRVHAPREGPGLAYAGDRLWHMAFPRLHVTRPAEGIVVERDVAVTVRDGTTLRLNLFRPASEGRFPVLACAHPYGKDVLPRKAPWGYWPLARYRGLRQPDPITFSAHTTWESPDPSYWVPRGYAVVNLDLRGFGTSGGVATLLSDGEAEDYADVIEWAGAQPWSSGKVGLLGVSYLAISQWKVAALRPRSLAAICPWEGWSDPYRDVAYPGGVREDGFLPFWAGMTERAGRTTVSLRKEQLAHPLCDAFWAARTPELERIEVPALVCATFSDQGLHARGCFEAYRRIRSEHRFLYTHRGGKWSEFYSDECLALQERFFDCFLKGEENGMREAARVRVEVRSAGDVVHEVHHARDWPPTGTRWTPLYLGQGVLDPTPSARPSSVRFEARRGRASFTWRVPDDVELVGPMKLLLHVETIGTDDANLFVAVRKLTGGRVVFFEGPFGFGCDAVSRGWQRLAFRKLDDAASEPHRPVRRFDELEPMRAGHIEPVEIELLPSATLFRRGDLLRLDVQGKWFWRRSIVGLFPGDYQPSPPGSVILHVGGSYDAHLLVPKGAGS